MGPVTTDTPTLRPTTLYRYGVHTQHTVAAKNEASRHYRRGLADAMFGQDARARVLAAVAAGTPLPDAAAAEHVSAAQVHGRARWDTAFRAALDEALEAYSEPYKSRHCGTPTGYRNNCRCGPCRAAHSAETSRYR